MCCIFTCCGWLIDLFQRLWTFTMSCLISSAVCCSFLTASMSGVALGYNYSLAEYIDLKETNVSIYLKRGVFDDEISEDVNWRRSGHLPIAGHIKESNLMTGASDEKTTLRSGRRLDDSIYESNDRNNFEGSLMRLTAKAPDPTPLITSSSSEIPMSEIIKPFRPGSVDQLKAIQSAINMRKAAAVANRRTTVKSEEIERDNNRRGYSVPEGRRAMKFDVPPYQQPTTYNSLRLAVPDDQINDPSKWLLPKLPPQSLPKHMIYDDDYVARPTYPSPVTPRAGPARPSRPRVFQKVDQMTTRPSLMPSRSPMPNLPKSIDEEMESFKDNPLLDTFDSPSVKEQDFLRKMKIKAKKPDDDYEEEISGVPLRRKRNIGYKLFSKNNLQANKNIQDFNKNTSRDEIHKRDNVSIKSAILNLGNDKVENANLESVKNTSMRKQHDISRSETLTSLGISSNSPIVKLILATTSVA